MLVCGVHNAKLTLSQEFGLGLNKLNVSDFTNSVFVLLKSLICMIFDN